MVQMITAPLQLRCIGKKESFKSAKLRGLLGNQDQGSRIEDRG